MPPHRPPVDLAQWELEGVNVLSLALLILNFVQKTLIAIYRGRKLDFEFLFDPIPNPSPGGEGSAIAPATRWTRAVGVLHLQGELEGVDVLSFGFWVLDFEF